MSRRAARPSGPVSLAARTACGLAAVFALVDLWQVAIFNPASLTVGSALALVGLYLGGGFLAALAAFVLVGRGREASAPVVQALLGSAGAFLVLQEVALRTLPPRSPWRPWAVGGIAVVAALLVAPVTRWLRRGHVRGWAAVVAGILLVAGGAGAVRGFAPRGPGGGPAPSPGAARGPNVILVTIDTLRADHLSCYGYERATSPVLDAFAKEGVLFTRAFAQSSWTKPSTASLLTSHYPTMHQANLERSKLADDEVLVFETMRAGGYTTAALSGNPWVTPEYGFDQGVDRFYSIYDERFARATLLMQVLKRVNKLVESRARVYNTLKLLVQGELSTTARDQVVTAEAARWLAENRTRPFFLYLHYMSPHHPYDPPPPYDRAFNPHPQDPPVTYYPRKSYYFYEEGDALPPEKLADMVGRYDGDILFVDTVFGKLLAALRQLELLDRTVVIVTADHGEEFYDHRNWGHGQSVYNELLHVPLLIRWPALGQGRRIEAPVMSVDVVPTILELTGVEPTSALAGRSLVALARGEPWPQREEAYSELIYRYGSGYALQGRDEKMIETVVGDDRRRSLFDLAADPREQKDVLGGSRDGAAHAARLAEVRSWAERRRASAAEAQPTEEMDKRLKALGYVN